MNAKLKRVLFIHPALRTDVMTYENNLVSRLLRMFGEHFAEVFDWGVGGKGGGFALGSNFGTRSMELVSALCNDIFDIFLLILTCVNLIA